MNLDQITRTLEDTADHISNIAHQPNMVIGLAGQLESEADTLRALATGIKLGAHFNTLDLKETHE